MKKVKEITFEQKCIFNDYCMRELGLNLDDNDRLVDDDTQSILQYREKFIKYQEDECVPNRPDEVEMDLLRNPRLMGILFGIYLEKFSERKGIEITSQFQSTSIRGEVGNTGITWIINGKNETFWSDAFRNESVRIFNLICKLNNTVHLYDFKEFDIIEE